MTQTLHKSDVELKSDVVDELEWTPNVDAAHIRVAANDGVITLSGEVGTYPEKRAAEQAALRVRGVTAVADEITVRNTWTELADTDIAREVGEALTRSVAVPADAVKAVVHNHVVTLSGMVTWNFQREVAEACGPAPQGGHRSAQPHHGQAPSCRGRRQEGDQFRTACETLSSTATGSR